MNFRLVSTLLLLCLSAVYPEMARACSVCLSSDAGASLLGDDADHAERLRVADENIYLEKRQGDERHVEWRSNLGVSYGLTPRLTLAATVPWVWKRLDGHGARSSYTRGVGDAELLLRGVIWQNRRFGPSNVLRLTAGFQAPTGNNWIRREPETLAVPQIQAATSGYRLMHEGAPLEAGVARPSSLVDEHSQIGTGAFAAIAGIDAQHFGDAWGLGANVVARVPARSSRGFRYGGSLLTSLTAGYSLFEWWLMSLSPLYRYAAKDYSGDMPDHDSGGSVIYAEPGMTFRVSPLAVRGKVAVPLWTHLNGDQTEYPVYSVMLSSDVPF